LRLLGKLNTKRPIPVPRKTNIGKGSMVISRHNPKPSQRSQCLGCRSSALNLVPLEALSIKRLAFHQIGNCDLWINISFIVHTSNVKAKQT
jgi:hypothetical protein